MNKIKYSRRDSDEDDEWMMVVDDKSVKVKRVWVNYKCLIVVVVFFWVNCQSTFESPK